MECFCDYDMPSVYDKREVASARKPHQCSECRRQIERGESYEYTFGIWGGRSDTFKTCQQCIALRDFVKAHVPCFCWSHGSIRDDAINTAEDWAHEAPGLYFGALRREVQIRRARAHQLKDRHHD